MLLRQRFSERMTIFMELSINDKSQLYENVQKFQTICLGHPVVRNDPLFVRCCIFKGEREEQGGGGRF